MGNIMNSTEQFTNYFHMFLMPLFFEILCLHFRNSEHSFTQLVERSGCSAALKISLWLKTVLDLKKKIIIIHTVVQRTAGQPQNYIYMFLFFKVAVKCYQATKDISTTKLSNIKSIISSYRWIMAVSEHWNTLPSNSLRNCSSALFAFEVMQGNHRKHMR